MHRSWKKLTEARGGLIRVGTARIDTASGAVFIDTPIDGADTPQRHTRATLVAFMPEAIRFMLTPRGWLSGRSEDLGSPELEEEYVGRGASNVELAPIFGDAPDLVGHLVTLRREAPKAALDVDRMTATEAVGDTRWLQALLRVRTGCGDGLPVPSLIPDGRVLMRLTVRFKRRVKRETELAAGVEALDALARRLGAVHGLEPASEHIERWWWEQPGTDDELARHFMLRSPRDAET